MNGNPTDLGLETAERLEGRHDPTAAAVAPSRARTTPASLLAARLVLERLAHLRSGQLQLRLPDGTARAFAGETAGPAADLDVRHWSFFPRLLGRGDIGAGESYMDGDWSSEDLVGLVRLFLANERDLAPPRLLGLVATWRDQMLHRARSNTRAQARRNIRAHYDLDNRFYALFLDPTMTYSAGIFEQTDDDLEQAQRRKHRRMAAAARVRPGDHVLEIGCGWGAFAELAASELGCRVTGITLSEEQARFARERIRARGLERLVEIRLVDYRDVTGSYDAIVSIEMLEAVGHRFLGDFFSACDRLLRPRGRAAIQSITIPDQIYDGYRRRTDWIRRYIFPGGHLPSLGAVQAALSSRTQLTIERLDNIGAHYATTLHHWRRRFWEHVAQVRALGFDERFIRMWDFYMASCEAAFADRRLGNLQLVLGRIGDGEPHRPRPAGLHP